MLKLAVLVSGGGTNLQAIIDAIEQGTITNAKIDIVISNNKNAFALERAAKHNIPARSISPRDYNSREQFNEELLEALLERAEISAGSGGSGRLSGGDTGEDGGGFPEPDHQYPSLSDPLLLRYRFLRAEGA